MRIRIAQIGSVAGDFGPTVERMLEHARIAAEEGCELIVFPMPLLTGPDPENTRFDGAFQAAFLQALERLRKGLVCPALVGAAFDGSSGPSRDAFFIHDGQTTALRAAAAEMAGEEGGSDELPVIPFAGTGFGVALDWGELDAYAQAALKPELIVYLAGECFSTDDEVSALAPAASAYARLARESRAWLLAVGAHGAYAEQLFAGGSFAMAPWGELAWAGPSFEECCATVEIDLRSEGPLASPVQVPAYDRIGLLWDGLSLALREMVSKQGFNGAALILDGGLQSSVAAALAVEALGPARVKALIVAEGEAARDAAELARSLRIEVEPIDAAALSRAASELGLPETQESLWRLACTRLAALAESQGLACLSAADKSSYALELGAPQVPTADLAPLGDVYRTDVAALAQRRLEASSAIPASAIARMAAPELGVARPASLSSEMRANEVDAILLLLIEQGRSLVEAALLRSDEKLAQAIAARFAELDAAHRRMPTAPLVSARSLPETAHPLGMAHGAPAVVS